MPVILPAVLAGALSATSITAGVFAFSWGTFLLSTVGSLVLGQISKALAPKPKTPSTSGFDSLSKSGQFTHAVRQPITPRRHVFGVMRVSGPYAYIASTGDNEFMHMAILLAAHESEGIDEIWIDDYVIPADWLDADGNVTQGRYAGYMRIRKHLGSPNQTADSAMVSELAPAWTENHRLRGITYIYVRMKFSQDVYPGGVPNISAVVRGRKILDPRTGTELFTTNCGLYAYEFLKNTEFGFGSPAEEFSDTQISAQASIADEIVDTENLDVSVASIDTATDIITFTTASNLLPLQLGDRVEVITSGAAPGGLATSTDYYFIPYQYKDTPRGKLAASLANALAGTAIDITSSGSGTHTIRRTGEPRYHGAGLLDTSATRKDNIEDILRSLAGRAVNAGGLWTLYAAAWREPTLSLNEGHLVGTMNVQTRLPWRDRFNQVKGIYISSTTNFQPTDYPMVSSDAYVEEDGEELPVDINMPYTNRVTTAQRIAKIELRRARQEISMKAPANLAAMLAQAGDNVSLSSEKFGWDEKAFEVTSFGFAVDEQSGAAPRPVVDLGLRETAEQVFSHTSSEVDDVDPAPNTNLPNARDVDAPSGTYFSSRAVDTRDGDLVYALVMGWNQSSNAFVREGGAAEVQFKPSFDADDNPTTDDDWRPSFKVDGSLTFTDVLTSSVNTEYDLRVRFINNIGVRSGWSGINGAIVGSSGGVGTTEDWGSVADSVGTSIDYGSVADSVGTSIDRGFVV